MRITDLSKTNEAGEPLIITTGEKGFELNRYSHSGDTYKEEPKSVSVASEGMTNYPDEANQKDMIKGGFSSFATNQDKNDDENGFLGSAGNTIKSTALSALNVGGALDKVQDINTAIKNMTGVSEPKASSFDSANAKILAFKQTKYKQIHMLDYKESMYYNDIVNAANTASKLQRGDLQNDYTHPVKTLKARFGMDSDGWGESAEDLLALNTVNQYNMYTSKPGVTITNKMRSDVREIQEKISDNYGESLRAVREQMLTGKSINSDIIDFTGNPFSPNNKSDAQARMINYIKNRNTYLQTIGGFYVKPFYSTNGFKNFYIPFEFMPEISEGSIQAKYQAEALLGRIGGMQVYTGTELSTVSVQTTYYALAPDDLDNQDMINQLSAQDSTNAWQYYWSDSRLKEIEYKLRSLVFPTIANDKNSFLLKPPIVQINLGRNILLSSETDNGRENQDTDTNLFKYPTNNINEYLRVTNDSDALKKYIVTSVQIDNLEPNIYSSPTLYKRASKPTSGQEDDGVGGYIQLANDANSGEYASEPGVNRFYRRGFKVTIQLTEVTENFLDIVPDFAAYYNAWTFASSSADKVSNNAKVYGNTELANLQDQLTASAAELAAGASKAMGDAKNLVQKAFLFGKEVIEPNVQFMTAYLSYMSLAHPDDYDTYQKQLDLATSFSQYYSGGLGIPAHTGYNGDTPVYSKKTIESYMLNVNTTSGLSYQISNGLDTGNMRYDLIESPHFDSFDVYFNLRDSFNNPLDSYNYKTILGVLKTNYDAYNILEKNKKEISKLKAKDKANKKEVKNFEKLDDVIMKGGNYSIGNRILQFQSLEYIAGLVGDSITSCAKSLKTAKSYITNLVGSYDSSVKFESKDVIYNDSSKEPFKSLKTSYDKKGFTIDLNGNKETFEKYEDFEKRINEIAGNLALPSSSGEEDLFDRMKESNLQSYYNQIMAKKDNYPLASTFDEFKTWYDKDENKTGASFYEYVVNDKEKGLANLTSVPSGVTSEGAEKNTVGSWCKSIGLLEESNKAEKAASAANEGLNE